MIGGFAVFSLGAQNEREVVVRVACVLVTSERLREMGRGLVVFAATVIRQAQGNVRGSEAGIAL